MIRTTYPRSVSIVGAGLTWYDIRGWLAALGSRPVSPDARQSAITERLIMSLTTEDIRQCDDPPALAALRSLLVRAGQGGQGRAALLAASLSPTRLRRLRDFTRSRHAAIVSGRAYRTSRPDPSDLLANPPMNRLRQLVLYHPELEMVEGIRQALRHQDATA